MVFRRRIRRSIRRPRRRSTVRRTRRFRRRSTRNSVGSKYDSGYLAKCTIGHDITSDGTNQSFLHVDWGTPTVAGVTHLQGAPEFIALSATF